MKRILRVIPKEAVIPEFRYLVAAASGMHAWNGSIGIRYAPSWLGKLRDLVDKDGTLAFPDASRFLSVLAAADNVTSISCADGNLLLECGSGRAKVHIPVLKESLGHGALPHLAIPWPEFGAKPDGEITPVWTDMAGMLSEEGTDLWGGVVGIYERCNTVASFDYGLTMTAPVKHPEGFTNVFATQPLFALGMDNMDGWIRAEGGLFLVGKDVQYYSQYPSGTGAGSNDILVDMVKMSKKVRAVEPYPVQLDFSANAWKRAKLFSKSSVEFVIEDGAIKLVDSLWSEVLGKTEAPPVRFTSRLSVLKRWATLTVGHGLKLVDGDWYVVGKTRVGVDVVGLLTALPIHEDYGKGKDTEDELQFEEEVLL